MSSMKKQSIIFPSPVRIQHLYRCWEAMKYGCHPIVSNLGANREWVLDGVNGSYMDVSLTFLESPYDVITINQHMITDKAIFEKSISVYQERVEEL